MKRPLIFYCSALSYVGNTLTAVACFGMLLGFFGIFNMEILSFGLSSGIRIIGTVAIAGCLLSAIGYGISEYASNWLTFGEMYMFKRSDFFIILAVILSFVVSAYLWFVIKDQQQAIFTAIWIPSIFTFGIYFKLCSLMGMKKWIQTSCYTQQF